MASRQRTEIFLIFVIEYSVFIAHVLWIDCVDPGFDWSVS